MLTALKALSDAEDLEEFLDEVNFLQENPRQREPGIEDTESIGNGQIQD
ncbi:hypothetical protein Trydic_g14239, partial [Trypoxylus dichotomus]